MTQLRIAEAATLLGVSDDTLRRWATEGRLELRRDTTGRQSVTSESVARLAQELSGDGPEALDTNRDTRSARNHFTGIVIAIKSDPVMSQVDLQCGPHRVSSLISTEAVEQLGLAVGSVATAVVKATNVHLEIASR